MATTYYSSKISPHISETKEGYLICHDIPCGRTGTQVYKAHELRAGGVELPAHIADSQDIVIHRNPAEVFDSRAMASLEGKPIADEHPDDDITPGNYTDLSKGHLQNVRRGRIGGNDVVFSDGFITDPDAIQKIKSGDKRGVSCGYDAVYKFAPDYKSGEQTQIRYNHLALTNSPRAGAIATIRDSAPAEPIADRLPYPEELPATTSDAVTLVTPPHTATTHDAPAEPPAGVTYPRQRSIPMTKNRQTDDEHPVATLLRNFASAIIGKSKDSTVPPEELDDMVQDTAKLAQRLSTPTQDAKAGDCTGTTDCTCKDCMGKTEDRFSKKAPVAEAAPAPATAEDAKSDEQADEDAITEALQPLVAAVRALTAAVRALTERVSALEAGEKGETKDALDTLIDTLKPKTADATKVADGDGGDGGEDGEDGDDGEDGEDGDEDESRKKVTVDPEDIGDGDEGDDGDSEDSKKATKDALSADILAILKPTIAKLPPREKARVVDALSARINPQTSPKGAKMRAIQQATVRGARSHDSAAGALPQSPAERQKMYDAMNPHKTQEGK